MAIEDEAAAYDMDGIETADGFFSMLLKRSTLRPERCVFCEVETTDEMVALPICAACQGELGDVDAVQAHPGPGECSADEPERRGKALRR